MIGVALIVAFRFRHRDFIPEGLFEPAVLTLSRFLIGPIGHDRPVRGSETNKDSGNSVRQVTGIFIGVLLVEALLLIVLSFALTGT
jgi:hypothetical protein